MERIKFIIIPILISIIVGLLYLYTAAPAMIWLDAGNMASAAATFGVSTPPAPLYVFIGHFFTLLPFGSLIFKLQIFSALTASATLFLLYQIISKILEDTEKVKDISKKYPLAVIFAGLFSILTLAFSYEFWAQAQNTDRFIFACFMEILILYLTLTYATHKKFQQIYYLVFFLSGLAFGIDPVVISFYPVLLFILWQKRNDLGIGNSITLCLLGAAGILLALAYLPLATLHNPFINFERPTTLARLWGLMTAPQSNGYDPTAESGNGFTGSFSIFLRSSGHYFVMMWQSFTFLLLPFVILGGWYLVRLRKNIFFMLIAILITNFILSDLYLSGNQESWYLLSDSVLAVFAGCGYFWIYKRFSFHWIGIVLFLLSFSPLIVWWSSLNRQSFVITDDYTHNLLSNLDDGAVVMGSKDLFLDSADYFRTTNSSKSHQIPIVDSFLEYFKGYRENLAITTDLQFPDDSVLTHTETPQMYSKYVNDFFAMNLPTHKIYITYPLLKNQLIQTPSEKDIPSFTLDTARFKAIPQGMVEEVVFKSSSQKPNLANYNFQFSNSFPQKKPTMLENVYNSEMTSMIDEYASAYAGLGDYYLNTKHFAKALYYYEKAYAFDIKDPDILNKLGLYYEKINNPKQALVYFTNEYKIINTNSKSNDTASRLMYNIGVMYIHLGQKDTAKSWLTKALGVAKDNPSVFAETGNALKYLGVNTTQQNMWQGFDDPQLGFSFTYPPDYTTQLVDKNLIGLFSTGQNDPTMELYSTKEAETMDLDTFAKTFPYAIKGTLNTSKPAVIEGFEQSAIYGYKTGNTQTELLLLKHNDQIVAVIIPLNAQTSSLSFATTLTKIIRSIRIIQ